MGNSSEAALSAEEVSLKLRGSSMSNDARGSSMSRDGARDTPLALDSMSRDLTELQSSSAAMTEK
jgi:hypothetical protein